MWSEMVLFEHDFTGEARKANRMTYSPVARLLTTLDLLQSRPAVTAAQLAERLEVETLSVRRYITMLQDIGIPVEAERWRYGVTRGGQALSCLHCCGTKMRAWRRRRVFRS